MKIKTSELEGAALDWAVAKVVGLNLKEFPWYETSMICDRSGEWVEEEWSPSTEWSKGGPLIECRRIDLIYEAPKLWHAELCEGEGVPVEPYSGHYGTTPLIAAMRAIVASELGDTVDVPEELL